MKKYIFTKVLSEEEKRWILESIAYVESFNIPISENIYFKHCRGFKEIGYCETEEDSKKADCTIALSIYLNWFPDSFEREFKQVCIHELLHTVKNRSKNPHKGSWEKYMKLIMSRYNWNDPIHHYFITETFYGPHLRKAKQAYRKKFLTQK